jgi:hypothetical protein
MADIKKFDLKVKSKAKVISFKEAKKLYEADDVKISIATLLAANVYIVEFDREPTLYQWENNDELSITMDSNQIIEAWESYNK